MTAGARTAAGDAIALTAFWLAGSIVHRDGAAPALVTLLVLLGCWFCVGAAAARLRIPGRTRTVLTWAVAVPLFVALRAVALHRPLDTREAVFLVVALAFTGLFVAAARLLSSRVATRG